MSRNPLGTIQNNSTIRPDTFTYEKNQRQNESQFGNSSQNPEQKTKTRNPGQFNEEAGYNNANISSRQQAVGVDKYDGQNGQGQNQGMGRGDVAPGPASASVPRENIQLATRKDRMTYYQPVYVQGGANVYPYPYANMDYVVVTEEENGKACSWPVCCAVFFSVLLLITAISLIVYYTLPSQQSSTTVTKDGNNTVITRVIYNPDQHVYHHNCIGCLHNHHYF